MKKVTKNRIFGCFLFLVFLLLLSFPISAENQTAVPLPEEYTEAVDQLPQELLDRLPEGLQEGEAESPEEALTKMSGADYLLSVTAELLGVSFSSAWRLLASMCALLILCSILREIGETAGSGTLSSVLHFCSTGCLFLLLSGTLIEQLSELKLYFDRLNGMMSTMIPVTGTVWAMGGNVSTASAGTATLYSFLAVSEALCAKSLLPMVGISTSLVLCNLTFPELGMGQFLSAIRKIYTVGIGFLMTLLVASLATQTAIGTAADGTGAKAAKFLSSTVIPVVGGSVGDTLRTVASGVEYVKSVVGISGILFVLLLFLPTLVQLLISRLCFLLGSGAADLLGCSKESRLLSEMGTVYGTMLGVTSMTAIMFILSFVIFMQTTIAIS